MLTELQILIFVKIVNLDKFNPSSTNNPDFHMIYSYNPIKFGETYIEFKII